MNVQEKINVIKEHKADFISALNAYLDSMYNMTDSYLDENGDLKDFLEPDEKAQAFVKELLDDEKKYENVRQKILNDDFELSLYEINLAGLAMAYVAIRFSNLIEALNKTKDQATELSQLLMSADNEWRETDNKLN